MNQEPQGDQGVGRSREDKEDAIRRDKEAALERQVQAQREAYNAEQTALFKKQAAAFISRSTPEQRKILQDELNKVEMAQPGPGITPVPVNPHAELEANEANKIKRAEEAVNPRPLPSAGAMAKPDVLDMSLYQKIGDQWRMSLGMVNGHLAHRWLSFHEARSLGLDERAEAEEGRSTQAGGAGGAAGNERVFSPPGTLYGVKESEGFLLDGSGRRVPIPDGHHAGVGQEPLQDHQEEKVIDHWDTRGLDQGKEPGA